MIAYFIFILYNLAAYQLIIQSQFMQIEFIEIEKTELGVKKEELESVGLL
jgi:hypothetical protein